MYLAMAAAIPIAQAGKAKLLAVSNAKRASTAPSVLTAAEAGYPDLSYEALVGLFGPRDMPAERRERIAADIRAVATDTVIADRLTAIGQPVRASSPAEFLEAIEEQRRKITSIVELSGDRPAQ